MLLDADTLLARRLPDNRIALFSTTPPSSPSRGGRPRSSSRRPRTRIGRFLVAYRERFYVVIQYLIKYGQAARPINVVSIVPGFASMYRTRILGDIDIAAPGLAIEDFNMTFEVHAKRLGRIAFRPQAAIAYTQDPDTFADYRKQLHRWTLGFWQTVRRHGFHFGDVLGGAGSVHRRTRRQQRRCFCCSFRSFSSRVWGRSGLNRDRNRACGRRPGRRGVSAAGCGCSASSFPTTSSRSSRCCHPSTPLSPSRTRLSVHADCRCQLCLRSLAQALLSARTFRSVGTWKSPVRRTAAHRPWPVRDARSNSTCRSEILRGQTRRSRPRRQRGRIRQAVLSAVGGEHGGQMRARACTELVINAGQSHFDGAQRHEEFAPRSPCSASRGRRAARLPARRGQANEAADARAPARIRAPRHPLFSPTKSAPSWVRIMRADENCSLLSAECPRASSRAA